MSGDPLQRWVDDLLPQADPPARELPVPRATPPRQERADNGRAAVAAPAYLLVSAGGLTLAVPDVDLAPGDPAADPPDGLTVIDLALLVTGRPGDTGRCFLRLARYPSYALRVEAVTERLVVAADCIRWRRAGGQPRPWLAGLMDEPAAAVISVADIVREAESAE